MTKIRKEQIQRRVSERRARRLLMRSLLLKRERVLDLNQRRKQKPSCLKRKRKLKWLGCSKSRRNEKRKSLELRMKMRVKRKNLRRKKNISWKKMSTILTAIQKK